MPPLGGRNFARLRCLAREFLKRNVNAFRAEWIAADARRTRGIMRDVTSQRCVDVYVGTELRHHQRMLPSGQRFNELQLDLLDREPGSEELRPSEHRLASPQSRSPKATSDPFGASGAERISGLALLVAASLLHEDASNPRTEFPDAEIDELAADIRERGILQPIVVHPADDSGQYRIHFGAMRLRAALRAGLDVVPVVVRDAAADPYAAVAENQKRHNLSPLDLARFIKGRVVAGESNAVIARKLGMDLTTVAHHLALPVYLATNLVRVEQAA